METTDLQAQVQRDQQRSAQSQRRVDATDDQILALRQQYQQLLAEAESLEQYNLYLTQLVTDQEQEMDAMKKQIAGVKETRQGVVPLMLRMLASLEEFVAADTPFQPSERQGRVDRLRTLMGKADISEAEKMRRLLEAYQIEGEYGVKMETYRGELEWQGNRRTVNYFHLGRVVFAAQSLDRSASWLWDSGQSQWRLLDDSFNPAITKAIDMANKRTAPGLLKLPVVARPSSEG